MGSCNVSSKGYKVGCWNRRMAGGIRGVVVSKSGGALFDYYKALGHIQTGYTIMFSFCAVVKLLILRMKKVEI
jgi:ACS family hexuronate transporter-like MFS transporter